jgi:hypothetical protein
MSEVNETKKRKIDQVDEPEPSVSKSPTVICFALLSFLYLFTRLSKNK